MSDASLNQKVLGRHMLLAGYVTRIVIIETGLSYKTVRGLAKQLRLEGYKLERASRACRGGATLIHNQTSKMQASLLMQLYRNIGGEAVTTSIDIQALTAAFRMYRMVHHEVPGLNNSPRWKPFSITDAWCLAQELRSSQAMLEECSSCGCSFFTSVNQRTSIECPFCLNPERHAVPLQVPVGELREIA